MAVPDLAVPAPGLIYCRGGIRKVGMVRKRRIMSMAKRGFVVFAPFYRGNEGGEGREDFGGEDRFDVCHAVSLVQQTFLRSCRGRYLSSVFPEAP